MAEIVKQVETLDYMIPGPRAGKAVSDALRWEVRRIGHFIPGREVREFMDGEPFTGQV